jgi:hypothetical protein
MRIIKAVLIIFAGVGIGSVLFGILANIFLMTPVKEDVDSLGNIVIFIYAIIIGGISGGIVMIPFSIVLTRDNPKPLSNSKSVR